MTQATTPTLNHKIGVFKGATANDGSVHPTLKQALDHSRNVLIKAALLRLSAEVKSAADDIDMALPGVSGPAGGIKMISLDDTADLADFLFANRAEIIAALNQEVRVRKPYTRTKKVAPASQTGLVGG
jgi:hypothetical protein